MIRLNFEPVIGSPEYPYKIVFTDFGIAEESEVWMFHDTTIKNDTTVWLEILNPAYRKADDDKPAGPDNEQEEFPYYTIAQWVYVIEVLSFSFPGNVLDENGEVILDNNRRFPLQNLAVTGKGPVKVRFVEHKGVLEYVFSETAVNLNYNLTSLLYRGENSHIRFPRRLYESTWEEIADLLKYDKCKLDATVPDPDNEGETIQNPEYPPGIPEHLQWKHLPYSRCVDYLLKNYDVRVLSKPAVIPKKEYLVEGDEEQTRVNDADIWTDLVWTKRKEMRYHPDIIYISLVRSLRNDFKEDPDAVKTVLFPVWSNFSFSYVAAFPYRRNLITAVGTAPTTGDISFVCLTHFQINPEEDTYHHLDSVQDYILETNKNFDDFYEFTCKQLPYDFFYDYEWSRIEISNYKGEHEIQVNHFPRKLLTMEESPFTQEDGTYTISGEIYSVGSDLIGLSNFTEPGRNVSINDEIVYVRYDRAIVTGIVGTFNTPSTTVLTSALVVGSFIEGTISSFGNLTITKLSPPPDNSQLFPTISNTWVNGVEATGITHKIEGFTTTPASSVFQPSELDEIFYYEIDNDFPTATELTSNVEFDQTSLSAGNGKIGQWRVKPGTTPQLSTTLRLKMVNDDIDFITNYLIERSGGDMLEDIAAGLAAVWIQTVGKVQIGVARSVSPSFNQFLVPVRTQNITFQSRFTQLGMNLETVRFVSYGVDYPVTSNLIRSVDLTSIDREPFTRYLSSFPKYPLPHIRSIEHYLKQCYYYNHLLNFNYSIEITVTP